MVYNLTTGKGCTYDWIDVTDPNAEELSDIAVKYGLHEESVSDCLQPGHLPKFEQFRNYQFTILRIFSPANNEADTVQEITNKIAIFLAENCIITIHRKPQPLITHIADTHISEEECKLPMHVFIEIVKACLHTYDEPGRKLTQELEFYETKIFLAERRVSSLKGLYFIKRKLDVIRRLLLLTYEIVDKIDPPGTSNAYTRDVRDLYVKQRSVYDSLLESTNHLLNIYFNISSQRTNETMRVLTVFSVFFMPLTFIVGIYGMNFRYMPELNEKYGYPIVLVTMVGVTAIIYFWFRRKKWL